MTNEAPKDSEQRAAEAKVDEFRKELGPFVVAADTTRMPMVFTDPLKSNNPIVYANESFLKLIGYEREEVLAQTFTFILGPDAPDEDVKEVESAFVDQAMENPEIQFRRKDGSDGWASLFVVPVRNESNSLAQHFVSLVDISLFKAAEKNSALLIDELNHRVKNTLFTVQSIVSQALRNSEDPRVARESIEKRLAALSRSHDLLGREAWEGVGLHDLISEVLEAYMENEDQTQRFTIQGENVRLLPKATLALGIAFNELATNAVKYGALSTEEGTISIEWKTEERSGGRWLCLHWREAGGPTVKMPERRGFGTRVIEQGLAQELQGEIELEFLPAGVVCTIYIPAPRAIHNE